VRHNPFFVIFLGLTVASCAHVTPASRVLPPVELLRDCPHPAGSAATNSSLAEWLLSYRDALRLCNIEKQALRDWAQ
jgi:hypothetical protein